RCGQCARVAAVHGADRLRRAHHGGDPRHGARGSGALRPRRSGAAPRRGTRRRRGLKVLAESTRPLERVTCAAYGGVGEGRTVAANAMQVLGEWLILVGPCTPSPVGPARRLSPATGTLAPPAPPLTLHPPPDRPTRPHASRRLLAVLTALLMASATILATAPLVHAVGPDQPVLTGSLQDELGCEADWDPACEATALAPTDVAGKWESTF